jgi:hypothetical protein
MAVNVLPPLQQNIFNITFHTSHISVSFIMKSFTCHTNCYHDVKVGFDHVSLAEE